MSTANKLGLKPEVWEILRQNVAKLKAEGKDSHYLKGYVKGFMHKGFKRHG